MVLVLVLGDAHIPHRASAIPPKFKELLIPNRLSAIICTGNLVAKEQIEYLRTLASEIHFVRGDFDENQNLPETKTCVINGWKIGICHGHQIVPWGDKEALGILQRQLDCQILVTGHTHEHQVSNADDKYFINPGSITGAWSPSSEEIIPTFMLMDLQESQISFYVYQLIDDQLKVQRHDYPQN